MTTFTKNLRQTLGKTAGAASAAALGFAVVFGPAAPALAQQRPGPTVLSLHKLGGGVYEIEGGVANQAFIVGDKGVVVFDAQRSPQDAQQALTLIATVTNKPVNAIVVSHADPDHVGGLTAYPPGIAIIAQENTKSEIIDSAADPTSGPMLGPMYRAQLHVLPTHTIGSAETMVLDGVRMQLMHVGPAHTSGDLAMYLPAQKMVLAADVITTNAGRFPVIHYASGGSSLGWIAFMHSLLALNAQTYVPGHGAIETKAQLQARVSDAEQRRQQVKDMIDQNKSFAEIAQALPETGDNAMFATFTQTVYDELTKGYPPAGPPWYNIVHKK